MKRIDKTVFISYRRTNIPWAIAIFQELTQHGYDVFFDFEGIGAGDFESVILGNIQSRAHFLIVLTPTALERCSEPADWLRREIEEALDKKRNIVPLMLEGFDFGSPGIARQLTGKLEAVKHYNALPVPSSYFLAAMARLRDKYLNVSLAQIPHPPSPAIRQAAEEQQAAANAAPSVQEQELTAQEYVERGYSVGDLDEKLRFYTEAIRLKPDYANAYYFRGNTRHTRGDLEEALQDFTEAIRLQPGDGLNFSARGSTRKAKGDLEGALQDFTEAIRLQPDYANGFYFRGIARQAKGDLDGAKQDFEEAVRLQTFAATS